MEVNVRIRDLPSSQVDAHRRQDKMCHLGGFREVLVAPRCLPHLPDFLLSVLCVAFPCYPNECGMRLSHGPAVPCTLHFGSLSESIIGRWT